MLLIDTDPGTDDFMAMLMLMSQPDFKIDAVCSVYGNVDLDNTSLNLSYLMSLVEGRRPMPRIFRGADKPIVGKRVEAQYVHGVDGISGLRPAEFGGPELDDFGALIAMLRETGGDIDILALGPLTNVAKLIIGHSDIRDRIRRIVLQGGAVRTSGNVTAAATFNHFNDPVAAAIVYESGIDIVQVGNDVCLSGDIPAQRLIGRDSNPIAQLLDGLVRRHWSLGDSKEIDEETIVQFNDALCSAYLLKPELFTVETIPLAVDWGQGASFGATIADFRHTTKPSETPTTHLAVSVDTAGYGPLVVESLAPYLV